jgi:acetyltransferase-like isoleucine patch superfamily enzyme
MTANKIRVRKFVPEELGATPAFVKIDVEGAESKVLGGMLDAFEQWSPRPPVLCEIGWGQAHPHWQAELAVFTRMLDLGYRVYDIDGRALDLARLTRTTDVLFLPQEVEPVRRTAGSVTRPHGDDGAIWVHKIGPYSDERGNSIEYNGPRDLDCKVKFLGRNNRLVLGNHAHLAQTVITFDCDNGFVTIGGTRDSNPAFRSKIRVGQDAQVRIGNDVSSTTPCAISAAEGAVVRIGNDVMFASDNAVRADDGHPIFDVRTGKRVNPSRSITIGNHVWLGAGAAVLGGAKVGDGSVIGYAGVVTRNIPNNCIAVGVPARVVRRHTAWERPHLTLSKPYYKDDSSTVARSPYWHLTTDDGQALRRALRLTPANVRHGLRRRAGTLKARLAAARKG